MSVTISVLHEEIGSNVLADVRHDDNPFLAMVHGDVATLKTLVGKKCLVEIGYERIVEWRILDDYQDSMSCICSRSDDSSEHVVRGRVHQTIKCDDGDHVVDLYLASADFVALRSSELGGEVPRLESGLEITVEGLCIYPSGT